VISLSCAAAKIDRGKLERAIAKALTVFVGIALAVESSRLNEQEAGRFRGGPFEGSTRGF
jgi:hypothetical protein